MPDYAKMVEALRQKKLAATEDKRKTLNFIDSDDSGMILPADELRKKVQTISGSGVPITDVVFNFFTPTPTHENGGFYGPRAVGGNFRDLLMMHPAYVDPESAMAGAFMTTFLSYRVNHWNPAYPFDELAELHKKYRVDQPIGALQHFSQDLGVGLALGWGGLREKVERYQAVNRSDDQQEFYAGLIAIIDGMQSWISRNGDEALRLLETETDPFKRENLAEMGRIGKKLVTEPPETFREACQWILFYQMSGRMYNNSGSLGRLDLFLMPYYEKEAAAGTLTDDEAVYYLACMLLRDTSYMQLGGYDAEGRDTANKLSYLILEAVHLTKIPSNIGVAVGRGLDRNLLRRGVELQFADKTGNPRFLGMDTLVRDFQKNGYSYADATSRTNTGCHWLSIPAREYSLNDCTKINFGTCFELAFQEMMAGGGSPSAGLLWELFEKHVGIAVDVLAKSFYHHYAYMKYTFPELHLDLLCDGPVEKGLDVTGGGVEFYNFCIDAAALATIADSFGAIQKLVVEDKKYTFAQLYAHLESNWAGADGEIARLFFAGCDKYGKGGSAADEYAVKISDLFTRTVKAHDADGHLKFIPGLFSWANSIPMGKVLGATPNGRHAGEPISHGANPNPGFREDGAATAMSAAIASVQSGYGNTAPMQIELEPTLTAEEGGVELIMALIEDHFENGGTLINLNVLDAEKIRKAHENPDLYPDLVVRVTGFSAYFNILSPEFRQLVVKRVLDRQIA